MTKPKWLLCFITLLYAIALPLGGSPGIGGVILTSEYDAVTKKTSVHIGNISGKEITAIDISFQVTFPDGAQSAPGSSSWRVDFLGGVAEGGGGIAPGATFDHEFGGQPGPVQAIVDMVIYADGTAEVVNQQAFSQTIAERKGRVRAWQKINELVNKALADPTVEHPGTTVAGQLKELIAVMEQQKKEGRAGADGAASYETELLNVVRDLTNGGQSAGSRSELEVRQLRSLTQRNTERILRALPHTAIKAVQ